MFVCLSVCLSVGHAIMTSLRKNLYFVKAHAQHRVQNGDPKEAIYGANKAFFLS